MGIASTYIILTLGLFCTLIITGYLLSKKRKIGSKEYWSFSFFSMISYSLIEGLRYNRGVDYGHYKHLYEYALHLNHYIDPKKIEPVFQIINIPLRFLDIPYPCAFIFYSFVLIFACFFFIRKHQKVALFALPMFFMATIGQSENLVRQFVAFSFILFSLDFFLTDSWFKFFIFMSMAILSHYSSIIFLPFFLLFKYIKNPFGNLYIILVLYSLSWLWKPEYWGNFTVYFQLLQGIESGYQVYFTNADIWLSGNTLQEFTVTTVYLIRLFIFNIGIIILGYRLLEKYRDRYYPFFYYLFIIGALIERVTDRMEILFRIDLYFYMFWFIVLAYIAYDAYSLHNKKIIYRLICASLLLNSLYDFLAPIFKRNYRKLYLFGISIKLY